MSLHCRSLPLLLLLLIRLLPFTSLFFFSLLFCFVFRCFCLFTRRAECHRNNMYVAVSDCCSRLRFFFVCFILLSRVFSVSKQDFCLHPPALCNAFNFHFFFVFYSYIILVACILHFFLFHFSPSNPGWNSMFSMVWQCGMRMECGLQRKLTILQWLAVKCDLLFRCGDWYRLFVWPNARGAKYRL